MKVTPSPRPSNAALAAVGGGDPSRAKHVGSQDETVVHRHGQVPLHDHRHGVQLGAGARLYTGFLSYIQAPVPLDRRPDAND